MAVIQINTNPTRRQLNLFGVIWLVFFVAVGAVARLKGYPPLLSMPLTHARSQCW